MLRELARAFLSLLYPPTCFLCEAQLEEENFLCPLCREKVGAVRTYEAKKLGLSHLEAVLVLAHYRQGLQPLFQRLKFEKQKKFLPFLTNELAYFWLSGGQAQFDLLLKKFNGLGKPFCLIPVPTDAERLQARGFDVPLGLFKDWAAQKGYVWQNCLKRLKKTAPQYELSGWERRNNMQGVVTADFLPTEELLILVDDIITTGATLDECARALKEAEGQNKLIFALALASDIQNPSS